MSLHFEAHEHESGTVWLVLTYYGSTEESSFGPYRRPDAPALAPCLQPVHPARVRFGDNHFSEIKGRDSLLLEAPEEYLSLNVGSMEIDENYDEQELEVAAAKKLGMRPADYYLSDYYEPVRCFRWSVYL